MNKILNFGKFLKMNESVPFNVDSDLVGMIDYTLLSPAATEDDILELCEKADKLGVKSVCVLPNMVSVAAEALVDSSVLVCTVVSFPHGTDTPQQKLAETKQVIANGADEVDMVLNYPELIEIYNSRTKPVQEFLNYDESTWGDEIHKYKALISDVATLVNECHNHTNKDGEKIVLKVIVESSMLTNYQTESSTYICLEAGADFIKTSTGMKTPDGGTGVAEIEKVKIMRDIINEEGSNMKIKASGGIRTLADMKKFEPYVDRFGMGFGSVDSIFSDTETSNSNY